MSFWTDIRDTVETAGTLVGNYIVPGSSILTGQLVSEGSQDQLNSTLGQIAQVGSSMGVGREALGDLLISGSGVAQGAAGASGGLNMAGMESGLGLEAGSLEGALTGAGYTASEAATLAAKAQADPSIMSRIESALGMDAGSLSGGASRGLAALASGGASLYGSKLAEDAARNATQEVTRQFDISQANQAPWLQAGKSALTEQQKLMGIGGYDPANSLAELQKAPGYQFRLDQGRRGMDAGIASRGGMGGGKASKSIMDWNQQFATGEYGNRLNQLAGLSGTGQAQASNMAQQGQQYGSEMGNMALAGGAARQSGILGAGNALSGYLNPTPATPSLKWNGSKYVYG